MYCISNFKISAKNLHWSSIIFNCFWPNFGENGDFKFWPLFGENQNWPVSYFDIGFFLIVQGDPTLSKMTPIQSDPTPPYIKLY